MFIGQWILLMMEEPHEKIFYRIDVFLPDTDQALGEQTNF